MTQLVLILVILTPSFCFQNKITTNNQFRSIFPASAPQAQDSQTFHLIEDWVFGIPACTMYRRNLLYQMNPYWGKHQTAAQMKKFLPPGRLSLRNINAGDYLLIIKWSYITQGYTLLHQPRDVLNVYAESWYQMISAPITISSANLLIGEPFERLHRFMKLINVGSDTFRYYLSFKLRQQDKGMLLGDIQFLKVSLDNPENWVQNSRFENPKVVQAQTFCQNIDFWLSLTMTIMPIDNSGTQACKLSDYPQQSIKQPIVTLPGYYYLKVCWKPLLTQHHGFAITTHVIVNNIKVMDIKITDYHFLVQSGHFCNKQLKTVYVESSVTLGHYLPKSGYLVNIVEIKTFDSKWKASNRFLITEVQIKSKKSVDIENDKTSPPIQQSQKEDSATKGATNDVQVEEVPGTSGDSVDGSKVDDKQSKPSNRGKNKKQNEH